MSGASAKDRFKQILELYNYNCISQKDVHSILKRHYIPSLQEDINMLLGPVKKRSTDWKCEYCTGMVPKDMYNCRNCGAPKQ
jgi:aspartate carbamoyltransferase regulatory subunit